MGLPGFEPESTGPKPAMLPGYTTAPYEIREISLLINFSSRVKILYKNYYAAGAGTASGTASGAPSSVGATLAAAFASAAASSSALSSTNCFS